APSQSTPKQPAKDQPADRQPADPCAKLSDTPCYAPGVKTNDSSQDSGDQQPSSPRRHQAQPALGKSDEVPRSDRSSNDGENSSSRDTIIDLAPPPGDARKHPESSSDPNDDITEFHPYDPHKAAKNVEVG